MRIVHSFTSVNCNDDNLFLHLTYFILSCIYAKESGFEIAVHCDERSKEILKIAPYDEIITDLEGVMPPANNCIYAWGKFEAMKNEPLGTIHIDGDVFLKSKGLQKVLDFTEYDCIVQSVEHKNTYRGSSEYVWNQNAVLFSACEYPNWAKRTCDSMYNCGVVGFNNQELKDEYFKTYKIMLERYNDTGFCVSNSTPDIIIEQQFLKDLVEHHNYKVKFVLPYCDCFDTLCTEANHAHYQHVIGHAKKPNLERTLLIIKKHNPDIYEKLLCIREDIIKNEKFILL